MGFDHVVWELSDKLSRRFGVLSVARGFLVAVEGVDGSGKTTHALILRGVLSRLVGDEYRVVYTHEPTGSIIGSLIRHVVGGDVESLSNPDVLAHLFLADRVYHLYDDVVAGMRGGVLGALANGYVVVSDRYKYSTIAYQSVPHPRRRTYTRRYLELLGEVAPPPHILVYIDVPAEEALKRILSTRGVGDANERIEKLRLVRENFRRIVSDLARRPEYRCGESGGEWWWRSPVAREIYECSRGGWPRVVTVNGTRRVEDVASSIAESVVSTAIDAGLLSTDRNGY